MNATGEGGGYAMSAMMSGPGLVRGHGCSRGESGTDANCDVRSRFVAAVTLTTRGECSSDTDVVVSTTTWLPLALPPLWVLLSPSSADTGRAALPPSWDRGMRLSRE